MNKNQLNYFIAAAESQNFTKAAEQFYISQTAITQQIHALEETLGCALFDRRTRPVTLTQAGRAFLSEAKAIVERMDTALERVHEASKGLSGTIRIGYIKGYERSSLSDVMRIFHIHHENVLLTFYRALSEELENGLKSGEYDIVFTHSSADLTNEKGIGYFTYERSRLVAILYSGHPFARRESLRREDLKSEGMILTTSLFDTEVNGPEIIAKCADLESTLMMVAAEEGISILPQYCTAKIANADNLVFIPLEGEGEEEEVIAAWKNDNPNPALRLLLDNLSQQGLS